MTRPRKIFVALPTQVFTFRQHLEGVLEYAHKHVLPPWHLYLEIDGLAQQRLRNLRSWGCDGIIAAVKTPDERQKYIGTGLPVVLMDPFVYSSSKCGRERNVVTFFNDHEAEGIAAAEYFLDRGFTSFGYIGSPKPVAWSEARQRGFSRRLAESGMNCKVYPRVPLQMQDDFSRESERMKSWLLRFPLNTAIFVVHDRRAQQVVSVARDAGIPIPARLAILGVDNDEVICGGTTPEISSIKVDAKETGFCYAKALDALLGGRPVNRFVRTVHTSIVTRASTDATAINDPFVARAIARIAGHLGDSIGVEELAHVAGCSVRTLQGRFQRVFGRGPAEELAARRIEEAARLLRSTDLPVGTIARDCGFFDASHLGLRMHEVWGLSPVLFRRNYR